MLVVGFFAPAAAVTQCIAALERVSNEREVPLVRSQCAALFANADFRRSWDATVGVAPPEILASLLAQATIESYCTRWPTPKPPACSGRVAPKEAAARWRALFAKIVDTDVAEGDRATLRAAFEKRWAIVFGGP